VADGAEARSAADKGDPALRAGEDAAAEPDPFLELKADIKDFREYDEYALDVLRSMSFYFAQRRAGASLAQAKTATCDLFGHEAPRGMCIRCGLGVELGSEQESRDEKRRRERDEWLAQKQRPSGARSANAPGSTTPRTA